MEKLVVIYGASGGIGSALARKLASRGQRLHLVARPSERLTQLAQELGASVSAGDVADPQLHEQVAQAAGPQVSGLVYAVGNLNLAPLSRVDPAQATRDFQIHALGALLATRALLPALKSARGAVVLCSSIAAQQGFAMHASVSMAKGAVEGLTVALAAELAPAVRVNAIAPSLLRTPLAAGILSQEKLAASIAAQHPLARLGEAQDAADALEFLLSEQSSWISGQVLAIDGGRATVRSKS